ncbi:MAG: hypothetical protein M1816_007120 [Peltula sp. TS41687]|nr:MAG: hypothetical protein M1816_007120 [Peltula sp. TS41687]
MTSTTWRAEYMQALRARDVYEKANHSLFLTFHIHIRSSTPCKRSPDTTLADRTAALLLLGNHSNNQPAHTVDAVKNPTSTATTTAAAAAAAAAASPGDIKGKASSAAAAAAAAAEATRLRRDLAEAQRSKAALDGRLKRCSEELERTKKTAASSSRRVEELSAERMSLIRAVRDRDEELKEKAKLFQNVQDEIISLNLQLNVAERRAQDLQVENKELVDRWMARMGREADALNDASRFS